MAVIDIVLLVLLGLSAIKGLTFGFVRQSLGLILTVGVIVLSIVLSSAVGQMLQPVFGPNIETSVIEKMTAYDSALSQSEKLFTIARDWTSVTDSSKIAQALGIPGFISGQLTPHIQQVGVGKLIDTLPSVIAGWSLNVIGFLVIFILLAIVSTAIQVMLRKMTNKSFGAGVDKILGMVVSLFKTYCLISIVISVFSVISNIPLLSFLGDWYWGLVEQSRVGSSFSLLYYLNNYNFVGNAIMSWISGLV